jgi:hypothetical protein
MSIQRPGTGSPSALCRLATQDAGFLRGDVSEKRQSSWRRYREFVNQGAGYLGCGG